MLRKLAIILFIIFLFASSASADVISRSMLSRSLANALYCQLTGCTFSGPLTGASNTIEQRNGVNAQTFRIFNTDDGAGNTERAVMTWSGNAFFLQTAATGTGAARSMSVGPNGAASLNLQTSATARLTIDPAGNAFFNGGLVLPGGSIFRVTGDFTSASSTALQTITGLSWVLPATTPANYPFHCEILYNQTVAAVSDTFGIQAASLAPTNIMAKGDVATSASVVAFGNLPTLSTTTATSFVTFTPSAITTVWNASLAGVIENPSGVANTINIMVSQSTAADLMVIKRGSYCVVGF